MHDGTLVITGNAEDGFVRFIQLDDGAEIALAFASGLRVNTQRMEKRDRFIMAFLHRKRRHLLLFPYVCFAAGEGTIAGDAEDITDLGDVDMTMLGATLVRMLDEARSVDIDRLTKERDEALRMWRRSGEAPRKGDDIPQSWLQLQEAYPALSKGPGSFLRTFAVAKLVERDAWKSRKLEEVVHGGYRGTVAEGDSLRISLSEHEEGFARAFLEFLDGR